MDGIGVLVQRLRGDQDMVEAYQASMGKIINKVTLEDNRINLWFTDGSCLKISDEGQSCCEKRYITTSDDLPYFSKTKLVDIKTSPGDSIEDEWSEFHEIMFLNVVTELGTVTFETHVEHNGYYGGFSMELRYFAGLREE
jgi:hypothetical protein